jgi:hypothetical protein
VEKGVGERDQRDKQAAVWLDRGGVVVIVAVLPRHVAISYISFPISSSHAFDSINKDQQLPQHGCGQSSGPS